MDAAENGPRLLTIQELAMRSPLSLPTLRRLVRGGKIPYFQPGGKGSRLLFPPDAIERAFGACYDVSQDSTPTADAPKRLAGPVPAWLQRPPATHG